MGELDWRSVAEAVRHAARATTEDELLAAYEEIANLPTPELFNAWFAVVIPILRAEFGATVPEGEVDVEEGALERHVRGWNLIGAFAIQNRQPQLAEELFVVMLQEFRQLQAARGRVHKGTPYHQIGWSKLAAGDVAGAREYFVFAAIEDLIRHEGDPRELRSPASVTLLNQPVAFTPDSLVELAKLVADARTDDSIVGRLKLENPELLVILAGVRPAEFGDGSDEV